MGKIYLIRHGETEWNREHRSQGCSNDIPLSEEGRMQAKLAAEKLKDRKIDFFYSSGLSRARETAEIIAEKHFGKVEVCNEFIEINFGEWEGMTFPEIKKYYNDIFAAWRKNPEKANVPGAESLESIKKRSMTKLIELAEKHKESNILIVSHGITAKVMIASMLNMSLSLIHNIKQDNTAINIFNYTDNKFEVECLNDICHLHSLVGEVSSFEMK